MHYLLLLIFVLIFQTCIPIILFEISRGSLENLISSREVEDQGVQNEECQSLILTLVDWISVLENHPLFFEDPFINYKATKTLVIDFPRACQIKRQPKRQPKKIDVQNSIVMILETVNLYNIDMNKAFEYIPNITASDCFAFCTIALDLQEESDIKPETLAVVKRFFEKGKSVMNTTILGNSGRNQRMMKKANSSILNEEQENEFRQLCSDLRESSLIKYDGQCKLILTKSFRKTKLEILNMNPTVEVYEDFLSKQEMILLSKEMSKFPFETAQTLDDDGEHSDVDFRVEVLIYHSDSRMVKDLHSLIKDITGLSPDTEDYLQVVKYRPGGAFSPHLDFYEEAQKDENYNTGNRVAQAMIFLSDVKLGGGFAMPELGIYVPPKAGTLVVWHNVDRNGENDKLSLHGGCPVWSGNKVAAITSYHALNQKQWTCRENL